jgi:hypothetical protein
VEEWSLYEFSGKPFAGIALAALSIVLHGPDNTPGVAHSGIVKYTDSELKRAIVLLTTFVPFTTLAISL